MKLSDCTKAELLQPDCSTCKYYRYIYESSYGMKCCHYLLQTHHARKRDGERCLSYEQKEEKSKKKNQA